MWRAAWPKWLGEVLGSVVVSALMLSAPAFVAGMLMICVVGDALISGCVLHAAVCPGSALIAAVRMNEFGGRACKEKKPPGSAGAAFRTASCFGVKFACSDLVPQCSPCLPVVHQGADRRSLQRTALR